MHATRIPHHPAQNSHALTITSRTKTEQVAQNDTTLTHTTHHTPRNQSQTHSESAQYIFAWTGRVASSFSARQISWTKLSSCSISQTSPPLPAKSESYRRGHELDYWLLTICTTSWIRDSLVAVTSMKPAARVLRREKFVYPYRDRVNAANGPTCGTADSSYGKLLHPVILCHLERRASNTLKPPYDLACGSVPAFEYEQKART